eukprot:EC851979.1.p1 GENE.EC851979.1~~EC851979.1.p1  ORF type:complete len:170 (+),score=48.72 EC851979.1:43-552(+)
MSASTATHDGEKQVAEFMRITNLPMGESRNWLQRYHSNLELAVEAFFAGHESSVVEEVKDDDEEEEEIVDHEDLKRVAAPVQKVYRLVDEDEERGVSDSARQWQQQVAAGRMVSAGHKRRRDDEEDADMSSSVDNRPSLDALFRCPSYAFIGSLDDVCFLFFIVFAPDV